MSREIEAIAGAAPSSLRRVGRGAPVRCGRFRRVRAGLAGGDGVGRSRIPTVAHISPGAAVLDTGLLVFREGLETILVLSAITASMVGANQAYRRPIAGGAAMGFAATLVTWFAVVGILSGLMRSVPALALQAGTGLLAVVVLLVVMNWFFHKVYWTGWISLHNRRKRALMQDSQLGRGGAVAPALRAGGARLYLGLSRGLRGGAVPPDAADAGRLADRAGGRADRPLLHRHRGGADVHGAPASAV